MKTARRKLPAVRKGLTHLVEIDSPTGKVDLYITVNTFEDGKPAEVFAKVGQDEVPMLDQWCRAVSILLQDGPNTTELVRWFGYAKYEPAGYTDNAEIRTAHSLTDYIVRWIDRNFVA